MARYVNADKLKTDISAKYKKHWEVPCSSEDRLIQSIVTDLRVLIEKNTTADVAPRAEVAREIVEFLFRRSESLQHLFKDNPDSAQCFRGRFELENAAIIIANEYGVDLTKEEAEKALRKGAGNEN